MKSVAATYQNLNIDTFEPVQFNCDCLNEHGSNFLVHHAIIRRQAHLDVERVVLKQAQTQMSPYV